MSMVINAVWNFPLHYQHPADVPPPPPTPPDPPRPPLVLTEDLVTFQLDFYA
jgi:hypothetical protein